MSVKARLDDLERRAGLMDDDEPLSMIFLIKRLEDLSRHGEAAVTTPFDAELLAELRKADEWLREHGVPITDV